MMWLPVLQVKSPRTSAVAAMRTAVLCLAVLGVVLQQATSAASLRLPKPKPGEIYPASSGRWVVTCRAELGLAA